MRRIVIIGGGPAAFMAAITAAEGNADLQIVICEATPLTLSKLRLTGGGRCNLTNGNFDLKQFAQNYPRGQRELLGPLNHFGPKEIMDWFERRGVHLKIEADGRVFPVTDESDTIVDCLKHTARKVGVKLQTSASLEQIDILEESGFVLSFNDEYVLTADAMLLATGGLRSQELVQLIEKLGHTIESPVPSLFTFNVEHSLIQGLEGLTLPDVVLRMENPAKPKKPHLAGGALLITHSGLSGPATLKLSAFAARDLATMNYQADIFLNVVGGKTNSQAFAILEQARAANPRKQISTWSPLGVPLRLWERFLSYLKIPSDTQWANLSNKSLQSLADALTGERLHIDGKSTNKEEFVTCGGVNLKEIDFKTMQSRKVPGLYFAGEVLDIDALTGGYNLQAAWTTGYLAGKAMAETRPAL